MFVLRDSWESKMMNKNEKINLLIYLNNEIDFFVDEVKKFIPTLLSDRYEISDPEYIQIVIAIIDADKQVLKDGVRKVYDMNLNDEQIDKLIIVSNMNEDMEVKTDLDELLDEAKDLWFDSIVIKMDIIIDQMKNSDFSN